MAGITIQGVENTKWPVVLYSQQISQNRKILANLNYHMSIHKSQAILQCFIDLKSSVWFTLESSMTSNTLWASVNFFGQITIQRYFVFVSTVELRTLYIQKLPYMNTFCEYILKKIGPTHAHFQYSARKLMPSLKSVLL